MSQVVRFSRRLDDDLRQSKKAEREMKAPSSTDARGASGRWRDAGGAARRYFVLTIFRVLAVSSVTPSISVTSPVIVTVCWRCGAIFTPLPDASSPAI